MYTLLKGLSDLEVALKDFLDSKNTSSRNAATFAKEKLDGFNNDGSTDDGSTDDGSTDDGSTDDGSTDDGSTDDGSMDSGHIENSIQIVIQVDTNYPNRVLRGTEMAVLNEIIRLTTLLKNSFERGVEGQIGAAITKLNVVKKNSNFEVHKRK